jgi:hypothetical protein
MKHLQFRYYSAAMTLFLVVAVVVFGPISASAQTVTYQPRTQSELIAYLYGRIAQLMEIKTLLERQQGTVSQGTAPTSILNTVVIETHSALDVTATTAVVRGEVVLYGKATASAWFEYGQDASFLDQKTRQTSIRSAYDRPVRQTISNLKDDERYYYRLVVQTNQGTVLYGEVYAFRTDEVEE